MASASKSATGVAPHKKLTIRDVKALGLMLAEVSDLYPLVFRTERDFYPLVMAYLSGRVPGVDVEKHVSKGKIDFALKGNNPTALELAVQPRRLSDPDDEDLRFAGHTHANVLHATQNESELKKLANADAYKTRFLLLVDLRGSYGKDALRASYESAGTRLRLKRPVRIVFVGPSTAVDFQTPRRARAKRER